MSIITFDGVTIWSTTDATIRGVGWQVSPGVLKKTRIDSRAPLGVGYWVKPSGVDSADHALALTWMCTTAAACDTLRALLYGLTGARLGALVLPDGRTIPNCALTVDGAGQFQRATAGFRVAFNLTFTEFP